MKKILMIIGLIIIMIMFSCHKGEECYTCTAKYKKGYGYYATKEYCGDWNGVREIERTQTNPLYENWRCTPK
ncbi:MAG: hypothetical protein ACOXZV_06005 [Bacteroidales bacterium]|jgi:amino acid permease